MTQKTSKHAREPYNCLLMKNDRPARAGIFIGTATTGLVRMEWAASRFNQVMPCNWSMSGTTTTLPSCAPLGWIVADAQNVIMAQFMESNSDWCLLWEEDNILPPDTLMRLNEYIKKSAIPVISGLYFLKSHPPEPVMYRGRGRGAFEDWTLGDKVWVDGVPTGVLLIHRSIIQVLWDESEEYMAGPARTRRVFTYPNAAWFDPEKGWRTTSGTTDLEWCSRIIVEKVFEKAGWPKYQKMKYPFLVDTNIISTHIGQDGTQFPIGGVPAKFLPKKKPAYRNGQKVKARNANSRPTRSVHR